MSLNFVLILSPGLTHGSCWWREVVVEPGMPPERMLLVLLLLLLLLLLCCCCHHLRRERHRTAAVLGLLALSILKYNYFAWFSVKPVFLIMFFHLFRRLFGPDEVGYPGSEAAVVGIICETTKKSRKHVLIFLFDIDIFLKKFQSYMRIRISPYF